MEEDSCLNSIDTGNYESSKLLELCPKEEELDPECRGTRSWISRRIRYFNCRGLGSTWTTIVELNSLFGRRIDLRTLYNSSTTLWNSNCGSRNVKLELWNSISVIRIAELAVNLKNSNCGTRLNLWNQRTRLRLWNTSSVHGTQQLDYEYSQEQLTG